MNTLERLCALALGKGWSFIVNSNEAEPFELAPGVFVVDVLGEAFSIDARLAREVVYKDLYNTFEFCMPDGLSYELLVVQRVPQAEVAEILTLF